MEWMALKLNITLSKTRNGKQDYLQVMSDDFMAVNIVLIADEIEVQDARVVFPQSKSQERRQAVMDGQISMGLGRPSDADAEDSSVKGRRKKR